MFSNSNKNVSCFCPSYLCPLPSPFSSIHFLYSAILLSCFLPPHFLLLPSFYSFSLSLISLISCPFVSPFSSRSFSSFSPIFSPSSFLFFLCLHFPTFFFPSIKISFYCPSIYCLFPSFTFFLLPSLAPIYLLYLLILFVFPSFLHYLLFY